MGLKARMSDLVREYPGIAFFVFLMVFLFVLPLFVAVWLKWVLWIDCHVWGHC